jgi:Protein of unknown function (DUF4239)
LIYLSQSSLWISGFLFLIVLPGLAMTCTTLLRRRFGLERLKVNNEVAGFKFATVGVLYAVLLAFAVIVVWEKYSEAENTVSTEAGAAVTVYRLSKGLSEGLGEPTRAAMTIYLSEVVEKEWPAMERGHADPEATAALNATYDAVLALEPTGPRAEAALNAILEQLDVITQARRARIVVAAGIMPGIIWLVLFAGAFVTIGFTFFFGSQNARAQAVMTGGLSLLIFAGLLIIVSIDHPFAGTVHVGPEALELVLSDFHAQR